MKHKHYWSVEKVQNSPDVCCPYHRVCTVCGCGIEYFADERRAWRTARAYNRYVEKVHKPYEVEIGGVTYPAKRIIKVGRTWLIYAKKIHTIEAVRRSPVNGEWTRRWL